MKTLPEQKYSRVKLLDCADFTRWIESRFLFHYDSLAADKEYFRHQDGVHITRKMLNGIKKNKEMIFCFDAIMTIRAAKHQFSNMLVTVKKACEKTKLHPVAVHAGDMLRSIQCSDIDNHRRNKVLLKLERKLK